MPGLIPGLIQDAVSTAGTAAKDAVKGFFGSDYLRDYTHASKTFRTGSYELAPKHKFLFHVYFDINPAAYNSNNTNYGLAVKTVKLPSYNIATHELNQYNRKRIVQTKIKYDPIEIAFHDDGGPVLKAGATVPNSGGMIRQLWQNYFNYHYNDSTKPKVNIAGGLNANSTSAAAHGTRTQYAETIPGDADWGYNSKSNESGIKIPFFNNITVFGFNQHTYVAYVLVNPIITRFGHDTYSYAESSGIMENTMTLDYETVVYHSGAINGKSPDAIAHGFGVSGHYDNTISPINKPGSQNTILGQGGLVDAGQTALDQLASGNILGAIQSGGTALKTASNMNLAQVAKSELVGGLTNAISGTTNPTRNSLFTFPTFDPSKVTSAVNSVLSTIVPKK